MVTSQQSRWTKGLGAKALALVALVATAGVAIAQESNFGDIVLTADPPTATVEGSTTGFHALSRIASRDRHGRICMGFADTTPDHIMTLEDSFSTLTVQVDSGGSDTTLLIQGPNDGLIRCGEDISRRNPDAKIQDTDWAAGTYRIWVGSHHQGQRYNYTLTVSP
jgi:hypothetical protein